MAETLTGIENRTPSQTEGSRALCRDRMAETLTGIENNLGLTTALGTTSDRMAETLTGIENAQLRIFQAL